MKKEITRLLRGWPAALALPLLLAAAAGAEEVAAVLSSDSGPYAEAYSSFKAELGLQHSYHDASRPGFVPPENAEFTVAFGARAAAADYPPGARGVYALSPSMVSRHGWHHISMVPSPEAAIAGLLSVQPGLKRLAVFWAAYPGQPYLEGLREAGRRAGVDIISAKLRSPDSFPERLRGLLDKMDAFWLMPDPALITPNGLLVLASFSCANSVPFYAPTAALVHNGATASLAPDFAQSGSAAAAAVKALLGGRELPPVVFVESPRLHLNSELKEKCRWPVRK